MDERRLATVRTWSAVLGSGACLLALVVLLVLLALPTGERLPTAAVVLAGGAVLSMPLWAAGLAVAFARAPVPASPRRRRLAFVAAVGTFTLFVVGQLAVLTGVEPFRSVGDRLYLVGMGGLFVLSVAVLLGTDRRFRW